MADIHSKTTQDHEIIKRWVENRGGRPAIVRAAGTESTLLRIDFGPKDESLEPIDWDEFFRIFDDNNLAFLYQEQTADGEPSRFFKFIRE